MLYVSLKKDQKIFRGVKEVTTQSHLHETENCIVTTFTTSLAVVIIVFNFIQYYFYLHKFLLKFYILFACYIDLKFQN